MMNSSMITNGKRDMDTGDIIKLIKQKIKMVDDAKQSVQITEERKFYKTYGFGDMWTLNDRRIYMESRKGSMRNDTFMKR